MTVLPKGSGKKIRVKVPSDIMTRIESVESSSHDLRPTGQETSLSWRRSRRKSSVFVSWASRFDFVKPRSASNKTSIRRPVDASVWRLLRTSSCIQMIRTLLQGNHDLSICCDRRDIVESEYTSRVRDPSGRIIILDSTIHHCSQEDSMSQ